MGEATQALEQTSDAGQAEGLTAASVDIATHFTLGKAVKEGALELQDFIASQLPCADVALEGGTLTVQYGVKEGSCVYRGHTFSGEHVITIEKDDTTVQMHHEWMDFSNGVVSLDGTADVTWDEEAKTRRVVHDSSWTHLKSGRVGHGAGDRVQSLLPGGIAEGIRVDGQRTWDGQRGHWNLAIDGVEMRWTDPVPQAGTYTLDTPFDKTVSMSFGRVDGDTIRVTVSGPKREFSFDVSKLGEISERP